AAEAYVEAEFDLPDGLLDEDGLEALAELRPNGEDGLALARRIFPDGRTRAYAWGRAAAREDVAAAAERLVAMSGQFEQRRLARPSYQLDVIDAFVGEEQLQRRAELRRAWRQLAAARRRHAELVRDAAGAEARPRRAARAGSRAGRRGAARRRAPSPRDRGHAPRLPRVARGRSRPARAGRGGARPDRRREAAFRLPRLRGAARARREGTLRA